MTAGWDEARSEIAGVAKRLGYKPREFKAGHRKAVFGRIVGYYRWADEDWTMMLEEAVKDVMQEG